MELQEKSEQPTSDSNGVITVIGDKIGTENPSVTFNYQLNGKKSTGVISKVNNKVMNFVSHHKVKLKIFVKIICLLLYLAYVGYSFSYKFGDEGSWRLLVVTAFGLLLIGWRVFVKLKVYKQLLIKWQNISVPKKGRLAVRGFLYVSMVIFFGVYVSIDVIQTHPQNLISLVGIVVLLFLLFIFSTNRSKIQWHTVFWGLALQFVFGIIILKTSWGKDVITYLSQRFIELNKHAEVGAEFVFTEKYKEYAFLFTSMPKVIVFCTILQVLNYLGVTQFIIKNIGGFLAFCLSTGPAESLTAAANIFLGTAEAAVIVVDYIPGMSKSELFCVFVTGLSSVAGIAMIVFIGYGVPAEYLLAANVMSAPAALATAKLNMPDTKSEDDEKTEKVDLKNMSKANSILDAVTKGGEIGLHLVSAIVVNILIFISILDLINGSLSWFGERAGVTDLSIQMILSYILWPLAYIIGTDVTDCRRVAQMLGLRAVTNPGLAYIDLGILFDNKASYNQYQTLFNDTIRMSDDIFLPQWNKTLVNGIMTDKSEVIATYALCGFSCIQNIGIAIGAIGALAPSRKGDLVNMATRAFVVSSVASFLTACIAGLLYSG